MSNSSRFDLTFRALTGNDPFPWQRKLHEQLVRGSPPPSCSIPTGLGKTSVIAIWLIAVADNPCTIPRRLGYAVNRRTVVDQSTDETNEIRRRLNGEVDLSAADRTILQELRQRLSRLCAVPDDEVLAISTLRGQFADNGEWRADPARPAVIVGTVDMIGSRLLFAGYGVGFKGKPLHAGFLGQDVLLIHDEAHLEPAFQELLIAIEREQERCKEFRPFRVMELSATSRGQEKPFELTDEEKRPPGVIPDPPTEPIHVVWRRQTAKKMIHLHENTDEKRLADEIAYLALKFKDSKRAILIFVRKVDDVEKVVEKLRKAKQNVQQLTGTLRGLERDKLAKDDPVFRRFLPKAEQGDETAYLVCTSAGEVGVNISADHLVCDLSTFESMAQRFGRVNRFGDRDDAEIHVVHPTSFGEKDASDPRREKTLELLRLLRGDASPKALGDLDSIARLAAFGPTPTVLPVSDILFDSWALTTIHGKLPGRPPVSRYLHGIADWEPPETHVAWREEVAIVTGNSLERYRPEDLLDDYPLKPHELLRDRSDRVLKHLGTLAEERPNEPVWLLDDDGTVEVLTLSEITEKAAKGRINRPTVLLPPSAGGLAIDRGKSQGMLDGSAQYDPEARTSYDVADQWYDENGRPRRRRSVWDDDDPPEGMRLIRTIDTRPESDDEEEEEGRRFWHWYERPASADNDGSISAQRPVRWAPHTTQVAETAKRIVTALELPPEMKDAIVLAAKWHDLGKKRGLWQRSIGNPNPKDWHAKSGKGWTPREISEYRHEFGSLLDVLDEEQFKATRDAPEFRDLVLHLIAAHHGRARPHFPGDETFDPQRPQHEADEQAAEVPRRFARLQRKYGRWGLAYLESLLRAADWAASAKPSEFVTEPKEVP